MYNIASSWVWGLTQNFRLEDFRHFPCSNGPIHAPFG